MTMERPPAQRTLAAGGCLYFVMLIAALAWIGLRGRMAVLPELAIGERGIWVSAGAGLATGLGLAALLQLAGMSSTAVRRCEQRILALLGPLEDGGILLLSLLAALAEELFFRLAVQDAFGAPVAVALYVALNTGPGYWAWAPIALVAGVAFSALVATGFGLLSATVAHAVMNYLAMRRILSA